MSREIEFILVFEKYEGKEDEFLKLLTDNWSDKIKIGKGTPYGTQIRVRMAEYSKPTYMVFGLDVGPMEVLPSGSPLSEMYKTSGLRFYTDTMSDDDAGENIKLFYDIFFTSCKRLKPIYGCAENSEWGMDSGKTRPCTDHAEYYQNPYLFCIEPPLFEFNFDDSEFFNFMHDKEIIAKLNEIEQVMSRNELIGIIKQYVEKVIESDDGGIGVLKKGVQACNPRFYIRRELRQKGIKLSDGLAEKYAKEYSKRIK